MEGDIEPTLGNYIKYHRAQLGYSARTAATMANMHPSYWARLESGENTSPSTEKLVTISQVLEVPLDHLYQLTENPDPLPTLPVYLRAKYQLPPEAVVQLESLFTFFRNQYGIPDDQPVFPPKPPVRKKPGQRTAEQSGGPWDDPSVGNDVTGRAA